MKLTAYALLSLGLLYSQTSLAQQASMPGTVDQQEMFLAGVAQALSVANASAGLRGTPLFCAPLDFALNSNKVRQLAESRLTGPHEPVFFVIAALDALQTTYPCR